MQKYIYIGIVALVVIWGIFVLSRIDFSRDQGAFGSVSETSEYFSTTTTPVFSGSFTNPRILKTGTGALGSVIITGAGAGVITLVDATTTNASLRSAGQATTSITLAEIPLSAAAGTYTFDVVFKRGLILTVTGTAPTSTVTWR